jgi:hypothetical protein
LEDFESLVKTINDFWLTVAKLPHEDLTAAVVPKDGKSLGQ